MAHPSVLAYGDTYNRDFPIILVVGREPNTLTTTDYSFGNYDFRAYPNCGFWNMAFKLVGGFNGLSTRDIKIKFERSNSSPIVFTDASSTGILNKVSNKLSLRETFSTQDIITPIETVFRNQKLAERIMLVLISGLSSEVYRDFKAWLISTTNRFLIPQKEIAFLYGTNYRKIVSSFTETEVNKVKEIFEQFLASE